MGEGHLTEAEVQRVLDRAAELEQREASADAGQQRGLAVSELERIAEEAGMNPANVRTALAELERGGALVPAPPRGGVWGAPLEARVERRVRGTLSTEQLENAAAELQRVMGMEGTVGVVGKTVTWTSLSPQRRMQIAIAQRGDHVEIGVSARFGHIAGGLYGGIGGGAGAGLAGPAATAMYFLTSSGIAAAGAALGVLGGSWLLARTIYRGVVRRRVADLEALADQIARMLLDQPR